MILDHLSNAEIYSAQHPGFGAAFRALRENDWTTRSPGRYELISGKLYINVDETAGRGRDNAVLEAHRLFVDIQVILAGCEEIGWRDSASCRVERAPYDTDRDIIFWMDEPWSWIRVPEGCFAIFWPSDAHAPLGGNGAVKKAVAKVAIEWP